MALQNLFGNLANDETVREAAQMLGRDVKHPLYVATNPKGLPLIVQGAVNLEQKRSVASALKTFVVPIAAVWHEVVGSNPSRSALTVFNNTGGLIYIAMGPAFNVPAGTSIGRAPTGWTVRMADGGYWEMPVSPLGVYNGPIQIYSVNGGTGSAVILTTEIS